MIEGLGERWLYHVRAFIMEYLKAVDFDINYKKTLDYLSQLQKRTSTTSFRKRTYQIRKYLAYLNVDWANTINPPSEPIYLPKRIATNEVSKTIDFFNSNGHHLQCKSLILLGASCGARAEELYQLRIEDLDLENRTIHINHDPKNHQSTKTKTSRISFFTPEAKTALEDYLAFYKQSNLNILYSQSHITRLFRDAPIQVKDLRKYFSQTWDRNSGPTGVKKQLMGHSLRSDVDCQHYNGQSEEDLKKIYDKVMSQGA
jgi:integrase